MAGKSKYDDRRIWMNTGVEAKLQNLANEEATLKRTHKIYQQASRDIERQVQSIYDELGVLDKANHWNFKGLNNPATKKSITELRKAVEAAGLADYLPEPLRNRMSVIEVKQLSNWLTLQKAGQDSHALTKDALLKTMQNQGKVWQSALEAGAASFVGFDRNICGYMMGANWEGGNFSSRLWNATNETWEKVRDELTRALANGQQPSTTKKHIRQLLKEAHNPDARGSGGLDYDVERIIRTENAKAATEADIVRWRESGVEKVQWLAVLEAHTCGACQERDGRVYELKKILDRPPLHPNCRCTLVPYDELVGNDDDTREYKNADGEYTTVQFAPYQALMTPGGALRSTALKVTDYFWQVSPWMTYTPPKTNISYTGEVDKEVADLIDRTIKAVTDQYPVIGDELAERYNNTITLHRGSTVFNGRKLDGVGGITDHTNGQLTITYPTGMRKKVLTELAELAAKEKAQGFWSTGAANHAIIHELGHVYADYLKSYGISIDNIIIKAAGKRSSLPNALRELKVGVSRYAGENADEAFAELFAKLASQDLKYYDKTVADFQKAILSELENKLANRAELSGGANAAAISDKGAKVYKTEEGWVNSLTDAEREALNNYSQHDYGDINKTLREWQGEYTPGYHGRATHETIAGQQYSSMPAKEYVKQKASQMIDKIDQALDRYADSKGRTVWRGIENPQWWEASGKTFKDLKLGDTFTEKGYSSASASKEKAGTFEGGVMFEIKIPAGASAGAPLRKISRYASEEEYLLKRNTKFKVVGIKTRQEIATRDYQFTLYQLEIVP